MLLEPRFEYFRPCLLRYFLRRSPPCWFHIQQYIVSWDTIASFLLGFCPLSALGSKSFRRSFYTLLHSLNTFSASFQPLLLIWVFLWARSGCIFHYEYRRIIVFICPIDIHFITNSFSLYLFTHRNQHLRNCIPFCFRLYVYSSTTFISLDGQ